MKLIQKGIFTTLIFFIALTAFSQPPGLDSYIDTVLKTFEVPGLSLTIVKDGKPIVTRGYGIKKLGGKALVSEHTLFPIASNSKEFTAVALAMLVEDGKLKLDDPVINYLPWFRMSDAWVTAQITVRDLLVHHNGIPAYSGDLLIFPPTTYTRKEIVSKVNKLPIVFSFRTTYAYDNILYLAAGEVVKAVSGMEWEDFIQTRILDKLSMTETVPRFTNIKNHQDVSASHTRLHGQLKIVDQFFEQAIGDAGDPAGGIASNALDMAKWLIVQLDSGAVNGRPRIYSASTTRELWKIVTPIPTSKAPAGLEPAQIDFWGYALGVRCYNYGKYKLIGHGGKLDGFVSQVVLVPQLKLGISVLTNQESGGAYWSIIYKILDYYMQNKPFNWIAGYKKLMDSSIVQSRREWQKANLIPTISQKYSLPLEKYTGKYKDALYGEVTITIDSSGLLLSFNQSPQLVARMIPFQLETFIAKFQNEDIKADAYASFAIGPDGKVDHLTLKIIDPDSDLSFEDLLLRPVDHN